MVTGHELSCLDARRIAITAQLLDALRPAGLLDVVRRLTKLLEFMVSRDEVAIARRRGVERLWDLAPRVYPDHPVVPSAEALHIRNERRLRALGIARSRGPACSASTPSTRTSRSRRPQRRGRPRGTRPRAPARAGPLAADVTMPSITARSTQTGP